MQTTYTRLDNIDRFMKDIEQYPRLTTQQEIELHSVMHGPDKEAAEAAREKLIVSNLRLVVSICHSYSKYKIGLADLVQIGSRGLVTAADKYDPQRCPVFGACAGFWIRQCIRRALTTSSRTVKLPGGMAQLAAKVAKVRNAFEAAHGRLPTDEELAEAADISLVRLNGARTADITLVSTNETLNEDSDVTFEDMLSQEDDSEERQHAANNYAIEQLLKSVDTLSDMDKFLLRYTYGLGCKAVNIEVLTTETGWCAARIRGRLSHILKELRARVGEQAVEV